MAEFSYSLTEILASTGFILGIIVGLTEITKRVLKRFLNENFVNDLAPVISIFWGFVYTYLVYIIGVLDNFAFVIYVGTILGLSASGLWDFGKRTIKRGVLGK